MTAYRTNKSAMTEKNKKKKFDFTAFKGAHPNEAPILKTDNDLVPKATKRHRQSSSMDIAHRVAEMSLNLKQKLSVHSTTTKNMLAGTKHEFFF